MDRHANSEPPLWPPHVDVIGTDAVEAANHHLAVSSTRFIAHEHLPRQYQTLFPRLFIPMAAWLLRMVHSGHPLLVGVSGAQGTGKTTASRALQLTMQYAFGQRCCLLSLDDFYLTKAQRQSLAQSTHPLLGVRGVPGTHDVSLINQTLEQLQTASEEHVTPLPLFDKAADDRRPPEQWSQFRGRPDVIIFEGWCVGAHPAGPEESLDEPLNTMESGSDPKGDWRHYVDTMLAGPYREVFARLDRLLFFAAPDWKLVMEWRRLQEQKLHRATGAASELLDDDRLRDFIATYERISRRMLARTPEYADVTVRLDPAHAVQSVNVNA